MTPVEAQEQLTKARELLASYDEGGARAILVALISGPRDDAWAGAHNELAGLAFRGANYEQVAAHANEVLNSPTTGVPRAIAVYWSTVSANGLGTPLDRDLVSSAIIELAPTEPFLAASMLEFRADIACAHNNPSAAREDLSSAIDLYERAKSILGAPAVHLRIAKLDLEDGHAESAHLHIAAGLSWLSRFPYAGFPARRLEKKLLDLKARIDT